MNLKKIHYTGLMSSILKSLQLSLKFKKFSTTIFCCTMEGSDDHQESSTAAEMPKPVQETGDSTTESSPTDSINETLEADSSALAVNVANAGCDTHTYASNAEFEELGTDETSLPYAEPSQEVGDNKPSALVVGAVAVDPEVREVYHVINLAFILTVMSILLIMKSNKI